MAVDPTVVKQAREWIDRVDAGRGLSNSWRLQIIQKRYRKRDVPSDTGTALECDGESCTGLPMRIRRFVPGCPWALVDQAIRYLICKAPYEGIIYNGLEIPGRYRPTLTMWTRDEQSTVDEQKPQNGTYTLIQDLIEEDCEDEETVVTGETCSYVETTEYHWSDGSPGDPPGCGPECLGDGVCQGVTYAIRSNRNEDGSFDWQLVKRVAKTQHAGPFDVECNGCTGRVTQETWDNLYGDPVSGYEARYGADCPGEAVALPGCDDEPGVKTQVQVTQNPDCTYKVSVTRRENLEYSDSWTDGTACRTRDVYDGHSLREVPVGYRPAVGETVRVQLKRNDDCTYDYQREITSAPEELEYSWTDGSECRPRTVTVLKDAKTMPRVPAVGPGETLEASIQRNQDCTWDAQFSVREPAKEAMIEWDQGSACQAEHVRSYQNSGEMPEVPSPGPGQTVSASIRRNDDCTYDGQVTVREGMKEEVLRWTQGSGCRPQRVTRTLNSVSVPEVPVPAEGQTVSASISRNSDCTYDGQVTVTEPGTAEPVTYVTGSQCVRVTEVAVRNAKEPLRIPVAKQGQTVQANVSRQDDCTYDSRYSVTEVSPEEMSWIEGSQCRVVESHHLLNQADYSAIPEPGKGQSVTASVQRNQDCTYDVSYKVTNPYGGSDVTWDDGPECKRRHHTLWIDRAEKPVIAGGAAGETVQASISFDPNSCTWSGQQTVTDAFAAGASLEWTDGSSCQRRHHVLYIDSTEKPDVTVGEGQTVQASLSFNDQNCTWNGQVTKIDPMAPDDMRWVTGSCRETTENHRFVNVAGYEGLIPEVTGDAEVSADVSKNADCTYDVRYGVTTAVPKDTGWIEWDSTTVSASGTYRYHHGLRIFYNQDTVPTPPRGSNVQVEVSLNRFCKYDGKISYTDLYEWTASGGGEGGIQNGYITVTRTEKDDYGKEYTVEEVHETRVFMGSGNEGTLAADLANGWVAYGGGHGVFQIVNPMVKEKKPNHH